MIPPRVAAQHARNLAVFAQLTRQLDEYFTGERRTFDVPLEIIGTPFQRRVWDRLHTIPYGETLSYGALATNMGIPGSARAIGGANARNPISILVPCHRLVGATGDLTGYAGGIAAKQALLLHEATFSR